MASKRPVTAGTRKLLLERQRSMVMKAADLGLSNLVILALDINPEVDARRLAEPSDPQHVPLVTACLKGHLDVVRNLVERCSAPLSGCRADLTVDNQNVPGVTPLWAASYSGNVDLVRYIIQNGVNVNKESVATGSSPLRVAAYDGHLPVVKFLVDSGADIDSRKIQDDTTPLMVACDRRHKDVAIYLLDRGANVNLVCSKGETALHDCCRNGDLELTKLLVQRGACITRSKTGLTEVLLAAVKGHVDIVNFLVDIPDCSRDDKADALELLGARVQQNQDTDMCLSLWKRAMEERQQPGKPIVCKREADRKVVAYGNATEIRTLEELKMLERSRDQFKLGGQCMLMAERILGQSNEETTDFIRYNAALYADNNKFDRALDLLQHALENISDLFPFQNHTCKLYTLVLAITSSGFSASDNTGEADEDITTPTYSQCLKVLNAAVSDFNRGEKDPQNDKSEKTTFKRQQFLKIILQTICLLCGITGLASDLERKETKKTVTAFVKTGVRGQDGDTLLHMACDHRTTDFDSDENDPFTAFTFPETKVVQVLLETGSDVDAVNEAGKTALQVARDQEGDHSKIVDILKQRGVRA